MKSFDDRLKEIGLSISDQNDLIRESIKKQLDAISRTYHPDKNIEINEDQKNEYHEKMTSINSAREFFNNFHSCLKNNNSEYQNFIYTSLIPSLEASSEATIGIVITFIATTNQRLGSEIQNRDFFQQKSHLFNCNVFSVGEKKVCYNEFKIFISYLLDICNNNEKSTPTKSSVFSLSKKIKETMKTLNIRSIEDIRDDKICAIFFLFLKTEILNNRSFLQENDRDPFVQLEYKLRQCKALCKLNHFTDEELGKQDLTTIFHELKQINDFFDQEFFFKFESPSLF